MEVTDEHNLCLSFFETMTMMAIIHFNKIQCDAAVIEVGVGGKRDATNIIVPSLSVITSVQMDHPRILGSTIEEIAKEKAGIIKTGVDTLIGPGCPYEIFKVLS